MIILHTPEKYISANWKTLFSLTVLLTLKHVKKVKKDGEGGYITTIILHLKSKTLCIIYNFFRIVKSVRNYRNIYNWNKNKKV